MFSSQLKFTNAQLTTQVHQCSAHNSTSLMFSSQLKFTNAQVTTQLHQCSAHNSSSLMLTSQLKFTNVSSQLNFTNVHLTNQVHQCSPHNSSVTFRDAMSWLRTYAERCLWRTVTVGPVKANFLLIYCDVYVCLVWNR